jgi:hypothetical protein
MPRMAGVARGAALIAAALVAPVAHAQAPAASPSVVLVASTSSGVDPSVRSFVDRVLQRACEARGYGVRMEAAPPDGRGPDVLLLWNRVHALHAEHALHAAVSARDGRYVVVLAIASRDGSGPRRGEVTAGQRELQAALAKWVQATLPAPAPRAPDPDLDADPDPDPDPDPDARRPTPHAPPPTPDAPLPTPVPAPPSWRLSLRDELVLGLGEDDFVGVLVGAGADYRIGGATWLGLRLVYANLPGRDRRVQASLWYAQLEQRVELHRRVGVPLRLGLGYLAANGSVLRLSAGLALELGSGVGLHLDLLAPTFWVTPDRTLFSASLGAEASLRF